MNMHSHIVRINNVTYIIIIVSSQRRMICIGYVLVMCSQINDTKIRQLLIEQGILYITWDLSYHPDFTKDDSPELFKMTNKVGIFDLCYESCLPLTYFIFPVDGVRAKRCLMSYFPDDRLHPCNIRFCIPVLIGLQITLTEAAFARSAASF